MAILLKGGTVVTMNAAREVRVCDVLLENDRISALLEAGEQAALAPNLPALPQGAEVVTEIVDVTGKVIIPGLVQGHMHVTQALFRGLADDLALLEWLRERIWPLEGAHSAGSNRASAQLAALELIGGGTTAIIDMGTCHHQDAIFEVMLETGLRGLFGKCMMDGGVGVPTSLMEDTTGSLQETERLIEKWHMAGGGRLRYALAPRFVPTCSESLLNSARDMARQNGLRIHTHASENLGEITLVEEMFGTRNVNYLKKIGYVGPDVILAHCIWLDDNERRILAETGTHVVHCPSSNTKLSSGIAPIVELQAMGVNVALGLDGAHNHMDGLLEARQASLFQKVRLNEPTAMPAMQALEMATLGGAAALGQLADLGSLEVGKKADLVVLDLDMQHTLPAVGRDVVSRIVYQATRENVIHTMVDGRFLYRNGKYVTLDQGKVLAEAETQCAEVMRRAGI